MLAVIGVERCFAVDHAEAGGELNGGAAAIATQALGSVAVIIFKVEVQRGMFFDKHQPVGAHTKLAVAKGLDLLARERKTGFPVVDHHKVVARGLIFIELNFHRSVRLLREAAGENLLLDLLVVDVFAALRIALSFLVFFYVVVRIEMAALLLLLVAKLLRGRPRTKEQSSDLIDHIRHKKYGEEEFENHKRCALNRLTGKQRYRFRFKPTIVI
jgi:hypothetical protein